MENEDNQEYIEENEEEVLDDDYLINLHRQLQEMKKQRKQAEKQHEKYNTLGGNRAQPPCAP